MQKMPLVSIVIPVYNVEEYLAQCIESILGQTYHNYELILVNDGSKDSSGKICEDYRNKDGRIRLIHKKNGGLSDARNAGMEIAKGLYITFVDSDDFIHKDYLKEMVSFAVDNNVDIVQAEWSHFTKDLGTYERHNLKISTGEEAFVDMLHFRNIHMMAWNKLYRRSLFENIYYPVGRINEDNLTTYKVVFRASKVACLPQVLYYYRINDSGIMNSNFSEKRFEVLSVIDEMKKYLGQESQKYEYEINYHEVRLRMSIYNACLVQSKKEKYVEQMNEIEETLKNVDFKKVKLEKKYQILLLILKISPKLYKYLVIRIKKE